MLNAWDTIRVPGRSCRVITGRSLGIRRRQQVERDDGRLRDVGGENVLFPELHELLDTGGFGICPRLDDLLRVDVEADAACPELLRRRNRNPAIPAPQIEHDVVFCDRREGEHAVDDFCGAGYVGDPDLGRRTAGTPPGSRRPGRRRVDGSVVIIEPDHCHPGSGIRPQRLGRLSLIQLSGPRPASAARRSGRPAYLSSETTKMLRKTANSIAGRARNPLYFCLLLRRTPSLATLLQWGTRDIPGW